MQLLALVLAAALAGTASAAGKTSRGLKAVTTTPGPFLPMSVVAVTPTVSMIPPNQPTNKPGTTGDPIMTGFDGRAFEFFGVAGNTYNVLSERTHQVSMRLKEGKMWDHEGTYVEAVGFTHLNHTVGIANEDDELAVTLDGERLVMRPAQTEQEVILGLAQGELQLLWQLHRPDTGNAVEVTTELLQIIAWVTPAGTRDEGGLVQPAYLNFEFSLLAAPAHGRMEGIVGRTYSEAASGQPTEEDDFKFHGEDADYEMASLFDTAHAKSVFGKASATKGRRLHEGAVTFPLHASSKGASTVFDTASEDLLWARKGQSSKAEASA